VVNKRGCNVRLVYKEGEGLTRGRPR